MLSVQLIKESIALFVEFQRLLRVHHLVVEFECVILEPDIDLHFGIEVDGRLLGSKSLARMSIVKVSRVGILWRRLKAFKEADSRSLSSWILSRFPVVVLEGMFVLSTGCMLAVWRAEKRLFHLLGRVTVHAIDLLIDLLPLGVFVKLRHFSPSRNDGSSHVFVGHRFHLSVRFLKLQFLEHFEA